MPRRRRRTAPEERPPARDRGRPIKVFVNGPERAAIEALARAAGLSASAYLRAVGLGYEPPSAVDLTAVDEMTKVNADLGRFGGLLKLWLGDRPGQGARVADVEWVLRQGREVQRQLLEITGRLLKRPGTRGRPVGA